MLLPTSTLYTGIDSTVTYSRPASTIQQRGGCLSTSGGGRANKVVRETRLRKCRRNVSPIREIKTKGEKEFSPQSDDS